MGYKKITGFFDNVSKVCAVAAAPAIVLSTAATVILFPATIIFSLFAGNLREKFKLIARNPVALTLLIFYGMFLVGTIYSIALWPDIFKALRKYDKFLFAVMFIPLFVEEKWRDRAINAFLGGIFIMLFFSYLREFGLHFWPGNGPAEVFKNSIEFAFLMAFGSYLCLFKIESNRCCRWLWLLFFILIVHTVFRSYGRSGYFVFAALMGLFFIRRFRWKGLFLTAVGILALFVAAYIFSPVFKHRIDFMCKDIKTYNKNKNTSVGYRMTFVKNSIGLIKSRPIIGAGTGSFAKLYSEIKPTPLWVIDNPHNEYLYITVQFGIIGLLILLAFFGSHWWYARFLPKKEKYIVYGAILSIMIGSLANSWLLDVTEGHFYAYFITLAFAALPKNAAIKGVKSQHTTT